MTSDERDAGSLARRREQLALPMVPLRHVTSPSRPGATWPDPLTWSGSGVVTGIGPDGAAVSLLRSTVRDDRVLAARGDGTAAALDGALRATFVQPLPQGRTLLVVSRARPGTDNAQVWDDAGRLIASAFVGDAVAHVLTTPTGSVWVGYFDEARDELGVRKLVRFDDQLRLRWGYPFPSDEPDLPMVFDVEALNVSEESAFCHAYPTSRLVRVHGDVVTDLGPTGLLLAGAVVLDGGRGAFVGGHGPGSDVVTPFRLRPEGIEVGAPQARLVLPDGRECQRLRYTARGAELYAVGDNGGGLTYRVTLDELLDGPRA